MSRIKFLDLAAHNREIQDEVDSALSEIHRQTAYVGGPQVAAFEREFADYLGVRHVLGVANGTDALRLALIALGIGPGDTVITTPLTFIATAEAIIQAGARPVFVDIDPGTYNIDPQLVRQYLERGEFADGRPKVILPVDLYGLPAPMEELCAIAEQYGLSVIEDACQAHGASLSFRNRRIRSGTVGAAGCFSFYPGKNLGAWGDAGAVATNSDELAAQIAVLRDHGRSTRYAHQACGYNSRLDAIQAAVLRVKLKYLDRWNSRRRDVAAAYRRLLQGADLILPPAPEYADSCYHLFVICSSQREALREALLAEEIDCGVHYPLPLHLQPALADLGYRRGDFPLSEAVADAVLSLPMHPHLTDAEIIAVSMAVKRISRSLTGQSCDDKGASDRAAWPQTSEP